MRHNRLISGFAGLALLVSSGVSALACGGAFMHAFLFQKHPEAKAVTQAVAMARDEGTLEGDRWDKSVGISLHAWRTKKLEDTIGVLRDRLNADMQAPANADGTYVFLINEFAWLDILTDGDQVTVSRTSVGPDKDATKLFTTRRVLDNLLDGTIAWQQAVEQGLIASSCQHDCPREPYGLLGLAMSMPKQKAQVSVH